MAAKPKNGARRSATVLARPSSPAWGLGLSEQKKQEQTHLPTYIWTTRVRLYYTHLLYSYRTHMVDYVDSHAPYKATWKRRGVAEGSPVPTSPSSRYSLGRPAHRLHSSQPRTETDRYNHPPTLRYIYHSRARFSLSLVLRQNAATPSLGGENRSG